MRVVMLRLREAEYAEYRGAYDELVAALSADGYEVRVEVSSQRRGDPIVAPIELAIYLFEHADNVVATAVIVDYVRKTLGRRRKTEDPASRTRRVAVYNQEDEVIEELELR
jgi:hypothetical protein